MKSSRNKVGDIQVDKDGSEWVVVGVGHTGLSRIRRNSMAHIIHARRSQEIAKSLMGKYPYLMYKIPK